MSAAGTRVAIVTGAGQGVGRAIAIALSEAGVEVAGVGRTATKLTATIEMLRGRAIAVVADLTDPDRVRKAFQTVVDRLGGVDILVNCAAEYSPFRVDEATDGQITNMVAQSLTSAIFCMREGINCMRRRGGGDIVNMSSQSVELPQPFMTVYAAAKAGVETISQGLRYELQGEDFRIMVCQIGVVADTVEKPGFAQQRERISSAWRKSGIAPMYVYPGTSARSIAAAVVHAITAPRDCYMHTIQLRSGNG